MRWRYLPPRHLLSSHPGFVPSRSLALSPQPPHLQLTREDIRNLPRAKFNGECTLIEDCSKEHQFTSIINHLCKSKVLGMDTESKPRQKIGPTSLVQLASEDVCVMWRLRSNLNKQSFVGHRFPPLLYKILTSNSILKVGHASDGDAILLLRYYHVNMCNLFDTYKLVNRQLQLPLLSLRGLAGIFLGKCLSKKLQLSNWESECLTKAQVNYASTDAWVSLEVYKSLKQYAIEQGVIPNPPYKSAWDLINSPEEKERMMNQLMMVDLMRAKADSWRSSSNLNTTKKASKRKPDKVKVGRTLSERTIALISKIGTTRHHNTNN